MAYIPGEEEEGQPVIGGQTGTAVTSGVVGGTQPSGPRGSGSWTNLQKYLDIGSQKAGQMASQLGQQYEPQRAGLEKMIGEESEQYGAGLVPYQQKAEEEAAFLERIKSGATPTQEEIQRFGGAELGPEQKIEAYRPSSGVSEAMENYRKSISGLGTEAGRLEGLKRIQRPEATRGEGLLNQLLLQGTPGARQTFQDISTTPEALQQQLEASRAAQQQALSDIEAQRQAYTEGAAPAIQETIGELEAQYDPYVASYQQQLGMFQDPVTGEWKAGTGGLYGQATDAFTQSAINKLLQYGADPEEYVRGHYYSTNPELTRKNLWERAKAEAATEVAGDIGQYLPGEQYFEGGAPSYTSFEESQPYKEFIVPYALSPGEPEKFVSAAEPFQDWLRSVQSTYSGQDIVHPEKARLDALNQLLGGNTPPEGV